MVYQQMGLLALSDGVSSEMSALLESDTDAARFAVEYFCRQVRACAAIGGFSAKAGGIDALVFTAGIGEHASLVRTLICEPLGFLGFHLDGQANQTHATVLNSVSSKPIVRVTADEEHMIFLLVQALRQCITERII